ENIDGLRVETGDMLGRHDALVLSRVSEHLLPIHIAYGVDAIDVGSHHVIDRDDVPLGLDADLFQADVLDVALSTDGHEERVGLDGVFLAPVVDGAHFHALAGDLDVVSGGTGALDDVHLLPTQRSLDLGTNVLVLVRDDVADEGYLGAVAMVDAGPLDTGGTAAADDDALRHFLEHHGVVAVEDALAVELDALDGTRAGARVDDDLVTCDPEGIAALLGGDLDRVLVEELAPTHEHGDLVLLVEEVGEPAELALDDIE